MACAEIGATDDRQQITVVGAGVVGTACTLQLQRSGHQVTLLDQAGTNEGCSFGNAGYLSMASVVPMALPGMLKQVPKQLVNPMGPPTIRWHYLPRALPWLLQWVFAGNETQARATMRSLASLFSAAFPGYQSLLDAAQYDGLIRRTDHPYIWRTLARSSGDVLAQSVRDAAGVRSQVLNAGGTRELGPALIADIQSGLLLSDNGFTVDPERLVKTLAADFTAAGGTFLRRRVLDVGFGRSDYGGPTRLHTNCGTLPVSRLVLCAGAWSARLDAKLANIRIPLNTERDYHATLRTPSIQPSWPTMDYERKSIAMPMEGSLRIAGTVEIGGLDAAPGCRRARILMRQGQQLFPGLSFTDNSRWMGHRPSLPSSLPMIDRSEHYRNVSFAFGYDHLGMTDAPGTARLTASPVSERMPFIDDRPYGLQRFRQRQPRQEPDRRPHCHIVCA